MNETEQAETPHVFTASTRNFPVTYCTFVKANAGYCGLPPTAPIHQANRCPTCHSPQPHLHPAVQHEGEVSVCKDPFHSQVTPQNPKVEMPIGLIWGENQRDGGTHTEWYAPCGCAFHPEPFPHVHPCSDGHKRPDLHATEEQAIVTAAREWATAWGKLWGGDESATDEVNDKSKSLHDAVLDLERELVLRRRRAIMPDYDKKLEDWLS